MNAFLTLITQIVSNTSDIGNEALVFISHFNVTIICGRKYFCIFDSHSKNVVGEISTNAFAVLLKLLFVFYLEECFKNIYCNFQHKTLYFQVQFISYHVQTKWKP